MLSEFLKKKGFNNFEGYSQQEEEQVKDLIKLIENSAPSQNKILNVIEIGFNAGHSAEIFLSKNNNIHLISFDIGGHEYLNAAKEFIDKNFPNRHKLILGNSLSTVPNFIKKNPFFKFDIIFIDGGHDYDVADADLKNCFSLAHENTIVILDNTIFTKSLEKSYTLGPTKTWNEHLQNKKIIELAHKEYSEGRGMAWGKYIFNKMNKKIWSYWESSGNTSEDSLVETCQASWKENCPDWTIRLLTKDTVFDWVSKEEMPPNFNELSPTFQSDFIRLYLLIKYGGLWADATYNFLTGLQWLEEIVGSENAERVENYYGFYLNVCCPESHFLYTHKPQNKSIKLWYSTMFKIAKYSPDFSKSPISISLKDTSNYFMIYIAYKYCIENQKNSGFVEAIKLPNTYEFYSNSRIIPEIPGISSKTFSNAKNLVKYTKRCRGFHRIRHYILFFWLLAFFFLFLLIKKLRFPVVLMLLLFFPLLLITGNLIFKLFNVVLTCMGY